MIQRRALLMMLLATTLGVSGVQAQSGVCTTHPGSLYCLPTRVLGVELPGSATNPFSPWSPVYSAFGSQLTFLPLPSPASGITLIFEASKGVYARTSESLGPILAERAETVGRHKLFVEFNYQRFGFSSVDGVDLKHFPIVFQACDQALTNNGTFCPGNLTIAATDNRTDVKMDQFTAFATFGLTSRVDVSLAVPIVHTTLGYRLNSRTILQGDPTILQPAAASSSATGIGDVTLRGKGTLWQKERFGLAAGLDLRVPTGDELNFLGSGAWGVKPFLIASYKWRVSPHGNLGYQWNGDSTLANPLAGSAGTGGKQLPTALFYALGADVAATKSLTIAGDFLSSRVFNALRLSRVNPFGSPSLFPTQNSFTTSDAAIGVKINPTANFLITANVDFKLDHKGLRHQPIPLVGISYTF